MSALSWMKRRALEREAENLRERIDAKRVTLAAQPVSSVGLWFSGAGLALASGFLTGVSGSIPSQFDRDSFQRLLMRASAAAITAAAAFVGTHAPDAVGSGPVSGPPATVEPDAGGAADVHVTRADLLQRLRLQRAESGRTR